MVQNLKDKEALRRKREQKASITVGDINTHDSTKSKETNRAADTLNIAQNAVFHRYLNFKSYDYELRDFFHRKVCCKCNRIEVQ